MHHDLKALLAVIIVLSDELSLAFFGSIVHDAPSECKPILYQIKPKMPAKAMKLCLLLIFLQIMGECKTS